MTGLEYKSWSPWFMRLEASLYFWAQFCINIFSFFLASRHVPRTHKATKFSTLFVSWTWLNPLDLVSDLVSISLLSPKIANQEEYSPTGSHTKPQLKSGALIYSISAGMWSTPYLSPFSSQSPAVVGQCLWQDYLSTGFWF